MNMIILGPQGSGKGTQAEFLAKEFHLFYFEAGSLLRNLAKSDQEIKNKIDQGILLPDEQIFNLVKNFLIEQKADLANLVFDGYPRSVRQYELLKNWLGEAGQKFGLVFLLEISEQETIRRLSARRTCEKCGKVYNLITNPPLGENCECGGQLVHREDDQPAAIKKRLGLYYNRTQPLVTVFEKEGILKKVNGERPIEEIAKEIEQIVKSEM